MKCIRKDIVIDNEQFENIKLEKDILFQIEHPFIVNMEYVFQKRIRIDLDRFAKIAREAGIRAE